MSAPRWATDLVQKLTEMADPHGPDRASLAHLRRGLDGPPHYTLARVGWLFRAVPDYILDEAVLTAGLFAWTRGKCPQGDGVNFGKAFGGRLGPEAKQQREKRFVDLLDTDAAELPYKLRQALTLLVQEGERLDWWLLLWHLRNWSADDRWVQKEWARGFWWQPVEDTTAVSEASTSE